MVEKIRSNILTEGSITQLVKVVDEEMDGIAAEQRKRLETIDAELEEGKRKLARVWHFIENSDIEMADASDRIKEHRERQDRLEEAAAAARAILAERRGGAGRRGDHRGLRQGHAGFPGGERAYRAPGLHRVFVKEIVVTPDDA